MEKNNITTIPATHGMSSSWEIHVRELLTVHTGPLLPYLLEHWWDDEALGEGKLEEELTIVHLHVPTLGQYEAVGKLVMFHLK